MPQGLSLRGATWNDNKGRRSRSAVVGALTTGLLACALGFAPAATAAPSGAPTDVIVRAHDGQLATAAATVRAAGGTVERTMNAIDSLAASVPSGSLTSLTSGAGVAQVSADGEVELTGKPIGKGRYQASADPNSIYSSLLAMGAHSFYQRGITGKGVDVAVIDSGVSQVPGLDAPGKVVYGPDLSFESQDPTTRNKDTAGHGTFMAGLIAGRDADFTLKNTAETFAGAAPDARIVAVKAADQFGNTDVSQVLAAIDWTVQNRNKNGLNIRVLNLSFGTDSTQSYLLDPLSYAVEVAWKKGIFVVVSAGNHGTSLTSMTNPASNPFVMAVGATDTKGTPDRRDDVIPPFSSYGTAERSPDIVAPGTSVTGLRVPGSHADVHYPQARIDERFFKGSGTSQAAAYVSGAAALAFQHRPQLTPDQLKDLFRRSAMPLPKADAKAQGTGAVNLQQLMSATPSQSATQTHQPSTGLGTLEGSRGSSHVALDGVTLDGERDIFGNAFDSAAWAPAAQAETSFADGQWNGAQWAGGSWSGESGLTAATWSAATWSAATWSAATWSAATWSAATWSAATWSAATWSAATWSAATWSAATWG